MWREHKKLWKKNGSCICGGGTFVKSVPDPAE